MLLYGHCLLLSLLSISTVLTKKAYFDVTSSLDLIVSSDILKQTTLSFRTCTPGGTLISQGDGTSRAELSITDRSKLKLSIKSGSSQYDYETVRTVTDNAWYEVTLLRSSDVVTLTLKGGQAPELSETVSTASKEAWILGVALAGDVKLGLGLNGCLESSTHAPFDDPTKIRSQQNVKMDQCPIEANTSLCDACSPKPCLNNGECLLKADGTYSCKCHQNTVNLTAQRGEPAEYLTGFKGSNCEENINECLYSDFCMNGGSCQDGNTSSRFYRCLCPSVPEPPDWKFTTGSNCQYTMTNCDLSDFPKCVNGQCKPTQFATECVCDPGWKGDRCEINIDECEINPCMYGGTCIDGIANYTCDCVNGTKGENCSINIDDCSPDPCKHGDCVDLINDFNCNCTDTGFKGTTCEINIDDCATEPCQNEGTCVDKIKDYQCDCHKAYTGKDCLTDIADCEPNPCNNGTCYEKSHVDNYSKNLPGFPAVFNHSTADGKVCVCEPGYEGDICQTDIDECAVDPKPCKRGSCTDGRNMFTCICPNGWTGKTCDEDVNECEQGNPCYHGSKCDNLPGNFTCRCLANTTPLYGGHQCTTILTGCIGSDCKNGGLCHPTYDDVTNKHSFTCVCDPDFTGEKCQEQNTMTFDGSAGLEFTIGGATSFGFDFKTSVSGAILAQTQNADASEYVIVELVERRVDVTYKTKTMTSSSRLVIGAPQLNDGQWRRLELVVKPNSLNVTVDKCGTSECSGLQILQEPLATTLVRVAKFTNSDQLSASKRAYHGCLRDLMVNGEHKLPRTIVTAQSRVELGCQRTEVCGKDWCNGFTCDDLWTTFTCHCQRPQYGERCEKSYPTVTLGSDGNPSLLSYTVSGPQAADMDPNTEISFVCRVAQQTGFLFYLGNLANPASYMSTELLDGVFTLRTRLEGQTTTDVWRTDVSVGNGAHYFVRVIRKGCQLEFSTALGNSAGAKLSVSHTVSDCTGEQARKLSVTNLYVGSLPQQQRRKRRKRAVASNVDSDAYSTAAPFGGTLQDMQIGNLQIKIADDSAAALPNVLSPASKSGVEQGEVTPDLCKDKPCKNSGTCVNKVWNDFTCTCTTGWRGKTCELTDRCSANPCPTNSTCSNTDDGFSCSREITLTGSQSLVYTPGTFTTNSVTNKITLEFRTREKADQNLVLKIDSTKPADRRNFALKTTASGRVVFEAPGARAEIENNYWDGQWHRVEAYVSTSLAATIVVDGKKTEGSRATMSYGSFTNIIVGNPFKGCLNEVRYADYVLPIYDSETLKADNSTKRMSMTFTYDASYAKYRFGCHGDDVCDGHQCFRGATCKDEWNYYTCACPAGFSGDRCGENIDECVNAECGYGLCRDGVNKFTCDCYPGYTGSKCETEVNECNLNQCQQNAVCTDLKNDFSCACTDKFGGKRCEIKLDSTCAQKPCKAGTCTDREETATDGSKFASYECACPPGKEGADCGATVDYCKQQNTVCKNGASCSNNATTQKPECVCKPGYSGLECEDDVDECASKPCKNGICSQGVNEFSCSCDKGWKGDRCDQDEDECQETPDLCKPGTCENLRGSYNCDCGSSGYLGVHCENRGPCADVTCQNNATCQYVVGTLADYKCQCTRGWRGRHCDQDIPECTEVKPCRNGATCTELEPLYNCTCLPGYTDENCSTNIDECANTPCLHDGKCEDGVNKYTCSCADTGYEGKNCATNINECLLAEDVCNGGNCTDLPGNFTCDCGPDWKGPTCAQSVMQEDGVNLALVIGPIIAVVILLFLIGVIVFLVMARGKRANRGVYSPSRHEMSGDGVQLHGPWLKPPPPERLI